MMRSFLIVAVLVTSSPAAAFDPGQTATIHKSMWACESDQHSRVYELAPDVAAMKRYLFEQAIIGRCALLQPGDNVVVESASWLTDRLVRVKGQTKSYWVRLDILKSSAR